MNIALLNQIQSTSNVSGESTNSSQSHFLDLLSSMLGTATPLSSLDTESGMMGDVLSTEGAIDLDKLAVQLESWLQQPETLQWLKSLPQDAYRTFMDAYVGLLAQIEPASLPGATGPGLETPELMIAQSSSVIGIDGLEKQAKKEAGNPLSGVKVEQHVQTIREIINKFSGSFDQTPKKNPFQTTTVIETAVKQTPETGMADWMAKGAGWSRPQIDVDSVMYASKGSLPENIQARIEAALQKAPFRSGADGSKAFTVRLYPEQLGELVVKLERHNGELVVKLFASNQEAKQLLQSQVQQLHQTLQPLSQNVRVEINLTQQAVDVKSTMQEGTEHSDSEQAQEQAKGDREDDEHPTEDE